MMGLFKKDNPADKKLKELTGGFILSTSYKDMLKRNGLSTNDGIKIQRQLKNEIKEGKLVEINVESRLNQLINKNNKNSSRNSASNNKKKCPSCHEIQDANNTFCIECGYHFSSLNQVKCPHCGKEISKNTITCPFCNVSVNDKICPICNKAQDKNNSYCIYCGYDFVNKKKEDTKNVCPNCHKVNYILNNICTDCGYDFDEKKMPNLVKICPKCKLKQKAANMYCRNCKEDLRNLDYEECDELIECINCGRKIPKNKDMCPFCRYDINKAKMEEIKEKRKEKKLKKLEILDYRRRTTFLNNYDFNLKTCPDCNTKFLKVDPYCFNCGANVITSETVKNVNLEVKDGKLVEKTEIKSNDELNDLEALYNQTVKSKYAPNFKVAYVLFLDAFRKNPTKKFPEKLAKKYDTTPTKLKKQSIDDDFIELASPLLEARRSKVTDLKEILKNHGLKVSGKKEELIQRLGDNLTEDELKKYFKSKNYQISYKGEEFLANNKYIFYLTGDKDISRVFHPSDMGKIFEENEYSQEEIYDKVLTYFKGLLDKKLTDEAWVDFKIYSNAVAQVQEDKGDLKDALNTRFKVFLFDINNFSIYSCEPDPRNTKLKQKDMTKLVNLMHKLTLPIDELKELFETAFNEVLFKTEITSQDSLVYLLKVFGGEDLDSISKEINQSYSNPR